MFTIVLIDDDVPIHPCDFGNEFRAQLKREIQDKYVDRVIANVGLVIEFYDFINIKDAHLYPGDGSLACGEAYVKVEFRLVVFQPTRGELLIGSISALVPSGIRVSLGFFEDVLVPSSSLHRPNEYDPVRHTWVWRYPNRETRRKELFYYEKGELVRFRVTSVDFPQALLTPGAPRESTMKIVGAMDVDGLGCVLWWPDSSFEAPPEPTPTPAQPIADAEDEAQAQGS
eukprot:NODE_9828_length_1396_cov_6.159968.p1 GENE.NODE_9828_length_1396_cov_6.159968~~NODE_9828_length_1396_cov_6.159968.p1  ORF type:complete len:228 (-),score=68.63 NODE_9828_length_1396_cov_6.159968:620-1303(-)